MIHWDWLLVLSIAWLLFELFAQPVLSIATASLKFGLDDFLNGLWLWRKDPRRGRARTCGMFYAAAGFWRITVMTLLLSVVGMFCVVIIQAANGPKPMDGARDAELGAGVSVLIVGLCFVASSVLTWLALILAWRNRTKVWLDNTIRFSRRNAEWPPNAWGTNSLSRVVTSALIFFVLTSTILFTLAVLWIPGANANGHNRAVSAATAGLCLTGLFSIAVSRWVSRSVIALKPVQCWSDDSESVTEADPFVFESA